MIVSAHLSFDMSEVNATNDKHELWIREYLIPTVIDKQQTVNQTKKQNLKKATIDRFTNDGGYLVTQCYKVILELDVDGDDKSIAFFVKVFTTVNSRVLNTYNDWCTF